ncbi:uncharacterized protein YjbI with pentapeptide repeats [Micromonospora pisi]|uniref:Uncharacterized protein YjbI with pentapeptide repeats n=1 Tax=Micromonospora pisi TaxID=589240 RepID=A0A495JEV4_9ACTN|nr:pentapeptide repeat-containing protein [Micromonospora pisi]RKR87445.1 uncharacterized protein YjbI with pentapeptide repeats [Micromonospora pisi]
MQTRRIGGLDVLVPDLDPRDLDEVTGLPDGDLVEALITEESWSGSRLYETRIRSSQLTGVDASNAAWEKVTLHGSVFERVDFSNAELSDVVVERCVFSGCRLTGTHFIGATLKNVVFENCRLDFAALRDVAGTGPVALVDCILTEASMANCRLRELVLRGCRLDRLEFEGCDLRGADLRGNELADILGALGNLRGVTLGPEQLADLAALAVRDLAVTVRVETP